MRGTSWVFTAVCVAVGCAAGTACGDDTLGTSELGDDDGDTVPWRGAWGVVHVGPFYAYADDGTPLIETLTVGSSQGFAGNFVNRGDVIVEYGGELDQITIEMRPFAHAATSADANALLGRVSLWAYAGATSAPLPPSQMDDATRCIGVDADGDPLAWRDDCAIYTFFDGDTQPVRTGADLRVTLPSTYRGRVDIGTSDNAAFDTYRDRGNVCVRDMPGLLDLELAAGTAWVTVASEHPTPQCPAASVSACESWEDPSTPWPDPWHADCPCFADGHERGLVRIESLDDAPMNATIEVPAVLWASFLLANEGENIRPGAHCVSTLDGLTDVVYDDGGRDPAKPWRVAGVVNYPPHAPAGGFLVGARSTGCGEVTIDAAPEDQRAGVAPRTEWHGDLALCTDCLADLDCAAMLAD